MSFRGVAEESRRHTYNPPQHNQSSQKLKSFEGARGNFYKSSPAVTYPPHTPIIPPYRYPCHSERSRGISTFHHQTSTIPRRFLPQSLTNLKIYAIRLLTPFPSLCYPNPCHG